MIELPVSISDIDSIRNSKFFSESWYLKNYPDVAELNIDPVMHYLWIGADMGRDPSPLFSTSGYLSNHPDVADYGSNPLLHYVTIGQYEGRTIVPARDVARRLPQPSNFIPRRHFDPLLEKKARLIALYLPQFHAFAENDAWWGKGFTEWTNVRPAKPHFVGHYQPHIPHPDIGYYDLTDRESQARQIELAKCHGVEGFCFYYYWFSGHRLMERPIDIWLEDASLDMPFCLCWANENWTRRWDGMDSEVLIAQDHSPEDDLGCIADLARYIRDPRYIRVDGKPLVMVYRPSLLPDPAATAALWRRWCRQNDIGEIYLVCTQSFDTADPRTFGFDAATEFPPNGANLPDITDTVVPTNDDHEGRVYDWRALVERSDHYTKPEYPLFRAVCPGWDNTARRKNKGTAVVNNTPALYQKWLNNAIRDTQARFESADKRLIFVNAWNEWAEGAHLEPDMRDGFAYLNATRAALDPAPPVPKLAIVIHAFYPDVLAEILDECSHLKHSFTYYVSTVQDAAQSVEKMLIQSGVPYKLFVLKNHGRDVLPFLTILEKLVEDQVDIFAKVHTKRSLHRDDGHAWRKELYDAVIGKVAFDKAVKAMAADPTLGMLGPDGHLVSMDTYLGSNEARIRYYSQKLGVHQDRILDFSFFAGTMFIARTCALQPLLQLDLSHADFEEEAGQIDGTLAHVIERIITICVLAGNYRLGSTADPETDALVNNRYGFA